MWNHWQCQNLKVLPRRSHLAQQVSMWVMYPECLTSRNCWMTKTTQVSPDAHYDDVIMGTMASQITSLTSVYSTVNSGADQSKHQSSASLAFVWGIHRGPVNSPHKWPVTRKMFPFDDVIMINTRDNVSIYDLSGSRESHYIDKTVVKRSRDHLISIMKQCMMGTPYNWCGQTMGTHVLTIKQRCPFFSNL